MAAKRIAGKIPKDESSAVRAAEYRRLAQVHAHEAFRSHIAEIRLVQMRLAQSYMALAENEEWLEGKPVPDAL